MGNTGSQIDDLNKNENQPIPKPRPSKKRRHGIMPTEERLRLIDGHVLKTPRYAESSIEKLGTYLTRPANNDTEKVRAIYRWITENIRYDTDTYFGRSPKGASNDEQTILSNRSSVCDGYASIFQLLCEHSNIPVQKISGHSKGYSYKPGNTFQVDTPTNHAWNAVFIGGEWRLVDTTWGAGVIGQDNRFEKKFTDFYFLTDPELFVVDHFPCMDKQGSPQWQLLRKPKPLDKFNKRVKTSRQAREWGVEFHSHQNECIEVNGKCTIEFHTVKTILDSVSVVFKDKNGLRLDQCSTVSQRNKTYCVTVQPPEVGKYTAEVFGTPDSESSTLELLVCYLIECKTTGKIDRSPLPKFDGCYGPTADCVERGFENLNKIPSMMTTSTWEVCLSLKVKDGTNVMAALHNSDDIKLVQYTLLEKEKNGLKLKARFPKKGYYRIIIYSQYNSEKYTSAFSILVRSTRDSKVVCPFPQTFPETVKFMCRLREPLTRDLPPNTDVRFRFSSLTMQEATVMREPVPPRARNTWDVTIKTPPSGEVKICGKDKKDGLELWAVYKFLVKK